MEIPKFLELRPREEIEEIVRSSLLPRTPRLLLCIGWFLAPFFLLFVMWKQGGTGQFLFLIWVLSGVVFLWRWYRQWMDSVCVLTNQRIIDHCRLGLFHRLSTEARYDQIDEVSYDVSGIASTVFRYGTVYVIMHGASANMKFMAVSHPARLVNRINELRLQTKQPS